jgi:hypothetical protein
MVVLSNARTAIAKRDHHGNDRTEPNQTYLLAGAYGRALACAREAFGESRIPEAAETGPLKVTRGDR